MTTLLRFFGLQYSSVHERRAMAWIAAMFAFSLASTRVLRPFRDQFGVDQGVQSLPWLYSLTLLATALCLPPFWWLANRVPSRRFVPVTQLVCAASVAVLAWALSSIGDYRWQEMPWLGELFWGGFSAWNVIMLSLVWIHAVEQFTREQGRRLFGFVAVGGTVGAVLGSWAAGQLAAKTLPWVAAVVTVALVLGALVCFLGSLPACRRMAEDRDAVPDPVAYGGVFAALPLVWRDARVRGLTVYMLLLAILATTFSVAQTAILAAQVEGGGAQTGRLANIDLWSQSTVLALQLFCTGRLLRRLPLALFLIVLPCASLLGLGAVWLWPTVEVISGVQVARYAVQHAFDKPGREVLYTPLDLETKHKAKFLLDTFVFRFGDLLGVAVLVQLAGGMVVLVSIAVAITWIGLGLSLGRRHTHDAVRESRELSAGS